jgi:deazaflavin-dependent oxidoreductase (nitroreductase family)
VTITVGRRHTPAVATGVPVATAERLLLHHARRHPHQARAMLHRLLPEAVPDADSYGLLAQQVVVVAVRPRHPAAVPAPAPAAPAALAPPRGLLKFFFNLPNLYYRWGLGWLLGRLFLQVTHTGRKSGLPRQTVLQVVRHDPATGAYYVFAGWGEHSDWVRNIQKTPEVTITVGRRHTPAVARVLSAAEGERAMADFTRRYPIYSRIIYRLCGLPADGSLETYQALARQMGSLLVAFQPTAPAEAAPPAVPRPPRGLSRFLYRAPIRFYEAGLGGLLGKRFLLLTHTGRTSGLPRQTVLEVMRHDPVTDAYYVLSSWGMQTDWIRNIQQTPDVTLTVGARRLPARATLLSPDATEALALAYAREKPEEARIALRLSGYHADGTLENYRRVARQLAGVVFTPVSP